MTAPLDLRPVVEDDPFEANSQMVVPYLSPSSISCYLRCPEQFRREYVLRERRAPGAWGAAGTAFHEARHAALEYARDNGKPMSVADLENAYASAWGKEVSEEVSWRDDEPDKVFDAGLAMTRLYHEELGSKLRPVAIEKSIHAYVPGVPVPLYGRVDVIDGAAGEIVDTKTGKQLFHKLKAEHFVQGMIYVYATGLPIRWHSVSQKPAVTTNDLLRLVPRPKVLASAERLTRQAYLGILYHLQTFGRDEIWTGAGMAAGSCTYCSFRASCAHVPA